ncbi:hypothetical protein L1987_22648 [Smallanthus sonchifolius]|uniref:Uncharacterized protein n=1 Tax=Smallanthus sonchifolius TaxID=185202 RepID=A0ACB9IFM4_9ASTR|nr:hypothetical protein L1987_22648 [Smallanthus sonchifolius]
MEARKRSSSSVTSCKKHPKHRQSPGICSLCLRERLSKILSSSSSSRAVTNVSSSSSSSSSISSVSSAYSSQNSSNASSYTASPLRSYRNRRKIDNLEGKGYFSFLRKNTNGVLMKSRTMAFVSDQRNVVQDHEKKKFGFLSKLMGSKRSSSRMMLSRTTRETFLSRV